MTTRSRDSPFDKEKAPVTEEDASENGPPSIQSTYENVSTPLLTVESTIKFLADIEPHTAAGIGGLIVIIVLTIFGRIGSLIVGLLAGLLIHASLERRRGSIELWKAPDMQTAVQKDVIPVALPANLRNLFQT